MIQNVLMMIYKNDVKYFEKIQIGDYDPNVKTNFIERMIDDSQDDKEMSSFGVE